jgi:hypothetical protein
MRSDLGWRDYLNLATSLQSLNSNRVSFAAIDEKLVIDTTLSTGAAVLVPRWDPIRVLVSESFGTGTLSPTTRTGGVASPSPSPSLPWPSPSPSPFPPAGSVAGSARIESLPGDPLVLSVQR